MRRATPWFGYLGNGITLGVTGSLLLNNDNGLVRWLALIAFCLAFISVALARVGAHRVTSQDAS